MDKDIDGSDAYDWQPDMQDEPTEESESADENTASASAPPPVLRPNTHSDPADKKTSQSRLLATILLALVTAVFINLGVRKLTSDNLNSKGGGSEEAAEESWVKIGEIDDEDDADIEGNTPSTSNSAEEYVPGLPSTNDNSQEPAVYVAEFVAPSVVRVSTATGQGSGIVWDASEGYIITNHHVVRDPIIGDVDTVTVTFSNGTRLEGEVVGVSPNQDVAVILVDPEEVQLKPAVFAPMQSIKIGQLAVAIGSPFGLTGTVTSGIVSGIRINLYGGSDPEAPVPVEMIQTDAPINPGNSGGALADRQGRVIGMNTSIQTAGEMGNVGVGFAVPSDTIELIANRIVKGESLDIGFLGISSETNVSTEDGVLITSVVEDSPADQAGIQVGDVIIGLEGETVETIAELSADIKLHPPGDVVELEIRRDKTVFRTSVVLSSYTSS
ncbi:MAG: trypsin-like peptidase domain-containing protein [Acidimicrobiaceae bacterium]|nr:trypsin-like peptidase domain-containing protein [Acidimicrobiaceae bacterium]